MFKSRPLHASRESRLKLYVGLLAAGALLLLLVLVQLELSPGSPWTMIALGLAAAIAERGTVRLNDTTELSISPVLTLFAAVLYGPLAGGLIGAASELGDSELFSGASSGRSPRMKWVTYTCTRFISGVAMGTAAWVMLNETDEGSASIITATLTACIVGEALEIGFASLTSRLRGNRSQVARMVGPLIGTAVCVYAPTVAALTYAYTELSPWTAALFLAPALAAQRLFSLYQEKTRLLDEQVRLTYDLSSANETLRAANLSFAAALVQTLEESDRYTAGHSKAVAIYTRDIAARMGMTPVETERAYLCGLVHDIGKIGLPASLLNKEGRLTLEERRVMETHSEIGERILSKIDAYTDVATVVRHHHERVDGQGYPDRLPGSDIPRLSMLIAVADAYNAMTSDRPYRKAMEYVIARDRLLQAMGSQFSTEVVVAFVSVLADAGDQYRRARGDEFGPIDFWSAYSTLSSSLEPRARGAA
jgi:putative nucleotidyltransferase with HDIG domain